MELLAHTVAMAARLKRPHLPVVVARALSLMTAQSITPLLAVLACSAMTL